ncbi:hypothetical protein ACFLVX_01050 [Chloroflexota bacterium]
MSQLSTATEELHFKDSRMENKQNQTSYYLVYVTHRPKGLLVMKQTLLGSACHSRYASTRFSPKTSRTPLLSQIAARRARSIFPTVLLARRFPVPLPQNQRCSPFQSWAVQAAELGAS